MSVTLDDQATLQQLRRRSSARRGTGRRRRGVFGMIAVLTIGYLALFEELIDPMRRFEVNSLAWFFRVLDVRGITGARSDSLLIVASGHRPLLAHISPSCSSLMGILALGVLSIGVLSGRRGHTVVAYVVSASMVFVLNLGRMAASSAAGLWLGRSSLILFHDWVGTVWNFATTLLGFLLLLYLTLPSVERAEQDRHGRHVARRPESWARVGLGYRLPSLLRTRPSRRTFTGVIVRNLLPAPLRRRLARRRESNRIDYRIGFLDVEQRCATVRELTSSGLDAHGASLTALAVFDDDDRVLDTLAAAIADHAHDEIKTVRGASLLLWQRAWSFRDSATRGGGPAVLEDWVVRRLSGGWWRRQRDRRYLRSLASTSLDASFKADLINALGEEGLDYHGGALVWVAALEEEVEVLEALANVIARRQWEPASSSAVLALRLWARGWFLAHRERASIGPVAEPVEATPRDVAPEPVGRFAHVSSSVTSGATRRFPGGIGRGGPFRVAVTGAGGPAGFAVVRALLLAGHAVVALDADPDAAAFSLSGVEHRVVPRYDEEPYASVMTSLVASTKVQALISTIAEEYDVLRALRDSLDALGCKTWLPEHDAVERCLDKSVFSELMAEYGLNHPPTATTARQARRLQGPWVVKPRRGRGSRGLRFVDDAKELRHIMRRSDGLIAQSLLEGKEFTADVLVDRDGQLVTCVPRWRLETRGGISVKGVTFDSVDVTRVCAEVIAATGISGPANIQGMVDGAGAVSVIELNPRFSGGLPLTLAAGADVVGAYLQAVLEPERKIAPLYFEVGVRMTRYFDEFFVTGA